MRIETNREVVEVIEQHLRRILVERRYRKQLAEELDLIAGTDFLDRKPVSWWESLQRESVWLAEANRAASHATRTRREADRLLRQVAETIEQAEAEKPLVPRRDQTIVRSGSIVAPGKPLAPSKAPTPFSVIRPHKEKTA